MVTSWTARVRNADLTLGDPVEFTGATLVENYGLPDMLSITGRTAALRPALAPDRGIVLTDDAGRQRFAGILDPTGIDRSGNGTASLIYTADTAHLWWRLCWPVPANPWTTAGQNALYDTQTGSLEARILGYINRNLGPGARAERRLARLRLPTSLGRGASGKTNARFQQLGPVVAQFAETAGLRLRIVQTYNPDGTPWLDLKITDAPDLTAWARFGDVSNGGPAVLSTDWRYGIGRPTGTTVLSAAGGEGIDRNLNALTDTAAELLWKYRVEVFSDDRGTGDAPDRRKTWVAAQAAAAANSKLVADLQRQLSTAEDLAEVAQNAYNDHPTSAHQTALNKANDQVDGLTQAYTNASADQYDLDGAELAAHDAFNAALVSDDVEIGKKMQEVLAANVGRAEISAPLGDSELDLGVDVPVGAKVAAILDGEPVVERLRQLTTVLGGDRDVAMTGVIGSVENGLQSPTQKKLAAALRRITNLERSL